MGVREPVQHVPDHPQLAVHGQGELRVSEMEQQRAGPDVLEDQNVLALVLVRKKSCARRRTSSEGSLTSMSYALARAIRSAARTSAGWNGSAWYTRSSTDERPWASAFRARYSVTSSVSPSDSMTSQWPIVQRLCPPLDDTGDGP